MKLFNHAAFFTSVNRLEDLPPVRGCEIAFAGRSNAGKSSAINALANRRRLAFVSKTPGRTQLINFFRLAPNRFLVDLPGYGYARVPSEVKQRWEHLLSAYLQNRESLQGLVLIMDARHPLGALDQRMFRWFAPAGRPVHVLLTKADKLTRQKGQETLRSVSRWLKVHYPIATAQLFSSTLRTGVEEAENMLEAWFESHETGLEK